MTFAKQSKPAREVWTFLVYLS